jgi:hypothetical protein
MLTGQSSCIRALTASDSPAASTDTRRLGDLLQLLIAHGDGEFVEGLFWLTKHRVAWIMQRDHIEVAAKAAGFVLLIISPFLAL